MIQNFHELSEDPLNMLSKVARYKIVYDMGASQSLAYTIVMNKSGIKKTVPFIIALK